MVDDTVNKVDDLGKGFELPLLLLAGFRSLIDELHTELAVHGHPDVRPVFGFAMQAVGFYGANTTEIGRRLGVSKQAAGKTIDRLEGLGYVERVGDSQDNRRKIVRLTPRGLDSLQRSAAIFDRLRATWSETLGPQRLRALESDLRTMAPDAGFRLDIAGWFGAHEERR